MNNITVKSLIQNNYPILHQAEKRVVDYILSYAHEVVNYSVTELSEKSHVSGATIIRTCKKLGYQGHYHLKIVLAKGVINPDNSYPDNTDSTNITSPATFLLKKQAENLVQSTQFSNTGVPEPILKLLTDCDATFSFVAGNSNPLAVYGAYKFGQLGLKTVVHVNPEMQINVAYSTGKRDLAIGISNSGSTNLMVDVFKMVKERGAKSVCTTNYIKFLLLELSIHQLSIVASDKTFFEAFDSTRAPATGVTDTLVLLFMYKNRAYYEKYRTREEFLGSRFKG